MVACGQGLSKMVHIDAELPSRIGYLIQEPWKVVSYTELDPAKEERGMKKLWREGYSYEYMGAVNSHGT